MSHYTVGYHDNLNVHYEICEYAEDAYNAIKQAREDLKGFDNKHACRISERRVYKRHFR